MDLTDLMGFLGVFTLVLTMTGRWNNFKPTNKGLGRQRIRKVFHLFSFGAFSDLPLRL